MSMFDGQTTGQSTIPNPGTQDDANQGADWLSKIVEAKGEKFKDPQVLAKSKLEADEYIKNLETQLKELRDETAKQDYAAKLLETLQQNKAPPTNGNTVAAPNPTGGTTPSDTKPQLSEDILKALVEKTLTEREKASTASQNQRVVVETLAEKYGTNAKAHVETKARELGMSVERLEELAAESPNAFFTLIGEPRKEFTPIVKGSINTQSVAMQATPDRDWAYYQKLRRENKHLYYSPATQQQMFRDKARLGDKFGNT